MGSNAVAVAQNGTLSAVEPHRSELTTEDLETLRATVFKGASDAQLRLYARTCRSRGLDPFAKEIYAWTGKSGGVEIVVGIDGLRNLAESSGEYRGQDGPWYCGETGQWTEVWLGPGKPLAAKVCVKREGMDPVCNVALLAECERDTPVWRSQLSTMLAIRAEAQAIRRLFPRQTTGLYVEGELERPDTSDAPVNTATANQSARPASPVVAEVVDADTGEITPSADERKRAEELFALIKQKRVALGWDVEDLRAVSDAQGLNLRAIDGLEAMWRYLVDLSAVMDSIKDTGNQLGWMAMQVAEQAELGGYDLKNLEHAKVFFDELQALKRATLDGPDDAPEQGTLLDADVAPIDRWAD